MFQSGERVLYGIHGICEIVNIETKKIDNKPVEYYVLEPIDQLGTTYYIPTQNETAVSKLRPILSPEELDKLLHSDAVRSDVWIADENQRKQTYRMLISGGDRTALLQMVHTLLQHKKQFEENGRKFHICDENFLRDAKRLLSTELSVVLNIPQGEVGTYIQNALDEN